MKRVLNIVGMLFVCSMLFCLPVKAADSRISIKMVILFHGQLIVMN